MASSAPSAHYQIPKEPGRNTSLILAAIMHGLLFAFLWFGIHWQSKTPVGVEAEIWDVSTRLEAPPPVVVEPPPPPEVVQPQPQQPSAKALEEQEQVDIAIERAKQKKLEEKKLQDEQLKQQKLEEQKLAEQKQQKLDQQKQEQEEKERKKQELDKIAEQKKADALAKKQRDDNLKRMMSTVASNGDSGNAVKSSSNNRVDPSYAAKIGAKIKSNMVFVGAENIPDNPSVDFTIYLLIDGTLRGAPKKTRSSGIPAFDDAVERAIIKSVPFPPNKSGAIPDTIPLTYHLKD